jgi:hypothetical protein
MTNSISKAHLFLWGYPVAFSVCWATEAVFWAMSGRRGSLLAFVLFRCEESLRLTVHKLVGQDLSSYPPSAHAISVVLAALVIAIPLAVVAVGAQSRALRWVGYVALVLLAFMTLYWPMIPRDLF